ncbi:MAG: sugar phosphate isomerase/epimerase family protein [Bryobacteraceae bacterium]
MTRRNFFSSTTAALAAASQANASARLPIKKAVLLSMLPKTLSYADRFKVAHDAGFEEAECGTEPDEKVAEEIRKAAAGAKIRIHSVMNSDHWKYPLSSSDPEVVAKCVSGMETSLRNAQLWGADTVLLVPAVVNPDTSYADAWKRSQLQIRKMLPMAEKMKVIIAVEEVWNKFLLSPLEFARYVDDFQSPYLKAYFDVGNVVLYGYPQDWIRTLGKRIVKVHLKDFQFKQGQTQWTALREGDINWKEIYSALNEVGYHGTATVELPGGDLPYLTEVSRRVDLIFTGA